jgi:hypothetical protein
MELEPLYNSSDGLPYNPGDVDIRQQAMPVDMLISMIEFGNIDLWNKEGFQRSSGLWSREKQSRLIESLIMRIPIPIFYLDGSQKPWKIIDGLQRITTLYQFIHKNGFELTNLEYLKALENKTFEELPFNYQRVIKTSIIQAYIINPGTPEKVKFNIFQRINTGGESLKPQEIRNAYFRGRPLDFINSLSKSPEFLMATNNKVSVNRMRDDEFVLRFFAFYKFLEFYRPQMDQFLDYSMEQIYKMNESGLEYIKDNFIKSMIACNHLFGEYAFTTQSQENYNRKFIRNIALFECWSVNLARLGNQEIDVLIDNKSHLLHSYYEMLKSDDFHKSISIHTSSKKAVTIRFNRVKELINTILNAY